ncbi:adaptor protein complex AP-1 [Striga asiatica]|uniref:Adaptor protein complex AP-1 n=1 Tax=Striga asiatica TaxID=4170 RepID=A0A5A7PVW4_STRAF|nr:adaptor protein complex AP-1 [Striga asiatica]
MAHVGHGRSKRASSQGHRRSSYIPILDILRDANVKEEMAKNSMHVDLGRACKRHITLLNMFIMHRPYSVLVIFQRTGHEKTAFRVHLTSREAPTRFCSCFCQAAKWVGNLVVQALVAHFLTFKLSYFVGENIGGFAEQLRHSSSVFFWIISKMTCVSASKLEDMPFAIQVASLGGRDILRTDGWRTKRVPKSLTKSTGVESKM